MTQQSTTPQTAEQALHTIANCIPSMVPRDARVTVGLHLTDDETLDVLAAEYGREVTTGGGTKDCPHVYRMTGFEINGVHVNVFSSDRYDTPVVNVQVSA